MIAIALGILLALFILWSLPVLFIAALLAIEAIFNSIGPLLFFLLCLGVAASLVVVTLAATAAILNMAARRKLPAEAPPAWTPQFRELKAQDPNGRTAELRRKLRLPPDPSKAEPRDVPWPPDRGL